MTHGHLSDWEIEELIIASRDRSETNSSKGPITMESVAAHSETTSAGEPWQHLENCNSCSSRKDRLQELLLLYREDAVKRTDAVLEQRAANKFSHSETGFLQSWRWGAWQLGLALLLLLVFLVPVFQQHQQVRERHEAQIARDNLLLEQVDDEVNSSVPHPLESLTNLVVVNENTNQ